MECVKYKVCEQDGNIGVNRVAYRVNRVQYRACEQGGNMCEHGGNIECVNMVAISVYIECVNYRVCAGWHYRVWQYSV